ncbi:MAG: alcohol dehydrogenase [Firmicutes bacterium HGW-Firmicutes-4]|jgi:alcohol dehydrogenase class IV|nr:MAG: alcohol dehydrogenase [Firmicutes bacterium HGW-Firmicutes-4]
MEFSFFTASKIVLKQGVIKELDQYVCNLGTNFLIVVDSFFANSSILESIKKQLESNSKKIVFYSQIQGEPTVEQVDEVTEIAIKNSCDCVISIGGGSCIDVGKAVAALITNGTPALDYMEVVGKGKKIIEMPVPFVACPTTAGTGSEATKNAVLGSRVLNFKRSMRSDTMIANVALLDPELTRECPKSVTAFSGIDALTHLIEAYTTWRATPISDGLALSGIALGGKYLQRAYDDGNDMEAREGMCAASLLGGMAFANSGLGAVHGIAMAVGIAYHVPHGESCGIMLPHIMKINADVAQERMDIIGETLTGKRYNKPGDGAKAAVEFIFELNKYMGIKPNYKHLNIDPEDIPTLAKASFGTSMSSNPKQLSIEEWISFFETVM